MTEIKVDSREPQSFYTKIKTMFECDVNREYLEVGDIVICGKEIIVIERKTLPDFISSISDKRIWNQSKYLKEYVTNKKKEEPENTYKAKIVIIDNKNLINDSGIFFLKTSRGMKKIFMSQFYGAIISIEEGFNIPVKIFSSNKTFFEYIKQLFNKLTTDKKHKYNLRSGITRAKTMKEKIKYVLQGFPGVGDAVSKWILNNFINYKDFINNVDKLENKIGSKKFKVIKDIIERHFEEVG